MPLVIGFETATHTPEIVLIRGGELLSRDGFKLDRIAIDTPLIIESYADRFGVRIADIDYWAVDVGPGRLGSTRSGVSFVNGLGFSTGKPKIALRYLDMIGLDAASATGLPVACIVHSSNGYGFYAEYRHGALGAVAYGPLERLHATSAIASEAHCIAGLPSMDLRDILSSRPKVVMHEAQNPSTETLIAGVRKQIERGGATTEPLQATTEQHEDVHVHP